VKIGHAITQRILRGKSKGINQHFCGLSKGYVAIKVDIEKTHDW